jgi:hypothetical protein
VEVRDLSETYVALLDAAIANKKTEGLLEEAAAFPATQNSCERLAFYRRLNDETNAMLDATKTYFARVSDFLSKYEEDAVKIEMFFPTGSLQDLENSFAEQDSILASLEESCGGA